MKQESFFKRFLCVVLTLVMLAGNVIPVHAHDHENADPTVSFTRVDNDEVHVGLTPNGQEANETEPEYAPTEIVRVSIVLEKASTIEAGFGALLIGFDWNGQN